MRRVLSVLLVLVFAVAVFASCGEKKEEVVVDQTTTTTDQATQTDPGTTPTDSTPTDQGATPADQGAKPADPATPTTPATNADLEKTVVFETNMGNIEFKLFADTPIAAKNMIDRVNAGKYNNLTFHRVIPDFMIQGGDPDGTGAGGGQMDLDPRPNRKNVRGTLSMASSSRGQPIDNQSDCQFFINVNDNAHLDVPGYGFIVFAQVTSGMDVCDKISLVETEKPQPGMQPTNKPVTPVTILKAYVK